MDDTAAWVKRRGGLNNDGGLASQLLYRYVQANRVRLGSMATIGQLMGASPRSLESELARLANTLLHLDRSARRDFEQHVTESGVRLLLYLDLQRHDESPMPVSRKQTLLHVLQKVKVPGADLSIAESAGPQLPLAASSCAIGKVSTPAKDFSTESRFAMLLQLPDACGGHFCSFIGSGLSWLQLLDTCTAEVVKQAPVRDSFGV